MRQGRSGRRVRGLLAWLAVLLYLVAWGVLVCWAVVLARMLVALAR